MNIQSPQQVNSDILSDWLIKRVSYYLNKDISEIATNQALAEYGLDSVYAISLCGDLEEFIGIPVEPTLAWDYPSIDEIVEFLLEELA
ncbi:MAG: acyl carrier protein [Xenococcaceae cyanobacterium MO_167.B27]|nr:acyl carrier protein [Xenococcaceae cyanobacterium MO_167.B27]